MKMSKHLWLISVALLLVEKVTIFAEYLNFGDIFLKKLAEVLAKWTRVNKHSIKLEESKQLFYSLIYNLGPVELKTLKIYIKTNLTNGFIRPTKSLVVVSIVFVKKFDSSFSLYINYSGFNNLTINNQYMLPLIRKFLN